MPPLRRHPDAVIAAHRMDPARRELYVEGRKDRLFLSWLLGDDIALSSSVREIAWVDLPEAKEGGERGRLLHFGQLLSRHDVAIRCLADADCDRVLGREVPASVWLTDHRDLEGYVLRVECIDKALRLGVSTTRVTPQDLLRWVVAHGRRLGLLRLLSELDSLSLPFKATRLRGHVSFERGCLDVDYQGYAQALLQNAGISLSKLDATLRRLDEVETTFASTSDAELMHGKDAMCLADVVFRACGLNSEEGPRLLWTSFEPRFVEDGSTLDSACGFLRGAQ